MENLSDIIKRRRTIESDVYNLLSFCLSENETIIEGEIQRNSASRLVFDYQLPQGLSKLDYPHNTHVEVKYKITNELVLRIRDWYYIIKPTKLIVVVLVGLDISSKEKYKIILNDCNIDIISFEELQEKASSLHNTNPKVDKQNEYDLEAKIIEKLKKRIKEDCLSIFIGAGVSASAGVPTWQALLERLCVKKGIPKMDSDIDELTKARFIIEEEYKKNGVITASFYEDLKDCLYPNTRKSDLLTSISKIVEKYSVESVINYNYDSLLEEEINIGSEKCESVYDKTRTNQLPVYHVHGFIARNGFHSEIVLGESEYHKIYQESYNWGNVEQLHALCRNTCLFIGLSMNDPNLRRLIDISLEGSDVEPVHFVFLRRIEYNIPFMEKTMRSFGINCVWYDEFSDLPKLLDDLCK